MDISSATSDLLQQLARTTGPATIQSTQNGSTSSSGQLMTAQVLHTQLITVAPTQTSPQSPTTQIPQNSAAVSPTPTQAQNITQGRNDTYSVPLLKTITPSTNQPPAAQPLSAPPHTQSALAAEPIKTVSNQTLRNTYFQPSLTDTTATPPKNVTPPNATLPATVQPNVPRLLMQAQIAIEDLTGKTVEKNLTVITDRAIKVGDRLVVSQGDDGRWRLLGTSRAPAAALASTNTSEPRAAIAPLPSLTQMNTAQLPRVRHSLASLINYANASKQLLPELNELQQQIKNTSGKIDPDALGSRLSESLQRLTQSVGTINQLKHPLQLQALLGNSGVQTEQKLQSLIGKSNPEQQLLAAAIKNNDQKVVLTQLIKDTEEQIIAAAGATPTAAALNNLAIKHPIEATFAQLFANLFHLKNSNRESTQAATAQLLTQIKLLATNSLAKIQFTQLQSLIAQSEADGGNRFLQMDIPIRYGNEIMYVPFQIFQEPTDKHADASSASKPNEKDKLWCVNLTLDIESIGSLGIELKLFQNRLSTRFWTENDTSTQKIQLAADRFIELLKNENIELAQLDIIKGEPPQKSMGISYNLVDVKT